MMHACCRPWWSD
ncbi:hypothetical protein AKJ16_DCAP23362, partial [Drosera capensis]